MDRSSSPRRSSQRSFACLLLCAAAVLLPAATAAADPLNSQFRISNAGTSGDPSRYAGNPAAAFDSSARRYLVTWYADDAADERYEIFGRFVSAAGSATGGQFRIGSAGGAGDTSRGAFHPRVVYNSRRREFLVVWVGDNSAVDNDFEIWGQRVSANGDLIGAQFLVSSMGLDNAEFNADHPQIMYNARRDEYFVVWFGRHASLGAHPTEVWGRRLSADGQPIGGDSRISYTEGGGSWPVVAYNSVSDGYLVAFIRVAAPGQPQHITVQRLDRYAANAGPATQVQFVGDAHKPGLVFNPNRNEYLVAWPNVEDGDTEISARRLSSLGATIGSEHAQLSSMGPEGESGFGTGVDVGVGFSPSARQYVLAWQGYDTRAAIGDSEIFMQSLDEFGSQVGTDDARVSRMGPDTTTAYGAAGRELLTGALAYDSSAGRWLVPWNGDDKSPGMADDEFEAFGRLVGPGAIPAPPPPPPPPAPAPAAPFEVGVEARRGRVLALLVTKVRPRAAVSVLCRSGCRFTGKRRRVIARKTASRRGGTVRVRPKKVRMKPGARLEVRVNERGRVARYVEFRVTKRFPYLSRITSGCMHPRYGTKIRC
jgi:hypothetical protein